MKPMSFFIKELPRPDHSRLPESYLDRAPKKAEAKPSAMSAPPERLRCALRKRTLRFCDVDLRRV
jgi:hypothetical protein